MIKLRVQIAIAQNIYEYVLPKTNEMSQYNPKIHRRRSIRLKGYDYSKGGLFFITICTQNKACLFGEIKNGIMELNNAGKMIDKWYGELENKFPDVKCHEHIVMPNHFHCIVENAVGADLCVCPKPYIFVRPQAHLSIVNPKPVSYVYKSSNAKYINHRLKYFFLLHNNNRNCSCNSTMAMSNFFLSYVSDSPLPLECTPIMGEHDSVIRKRTPMMGEHDSVIRKRTSMMGEHDSVIRKRTPMMGEHASVIRKCTPMMGEHIGSPLRAILQWFKTMTTNEYIRNVKSDNWVRFDKKLWQRNYWEHIIRTDRSYRNISEYIVNNPSKWRSDKFNSNLK